jgi:hypothetical protein
MSCCGKKRVAPSAATPSTASAGVNGSTYDNQVGSSAGPATRETRFEYQGGRVLTVTGQGTGYQYRFVGFGARLSVDARDRTSLAAVPQLREVRT